MAKHTDFFDEKGHLSHEARAMLAEQMMGKEHEQQIPEAVNIHLGKCRDCESAVFDLYSDISTESDVMFSIGLPPKHIRSRYLRAEKFINIMKYTSVAAIIILMVMLGRWLFFAPPNIDAIFHANFSPYQNLITSKGDGDNTLSKAMLFYDVKDYDSAIILFKTVLLTNSHSAAANFYLGNAFLAVDEADSAVIYFNKAIVESNRFADAAQWYLALAYLKNKELANAELLLKAIIAKDNFWSAKAETLLGEIR